MHDELGALQRLGERAVAVRRDACVKGHLQPGMRPLVLDLGDELVVEPGAPEANRVAAHRGDLRHRASHVSRTENRHEHGPLLIMAHSRARALH